MNSKEKMGMWVLECWWGNFCQKGCIWGMRVLECWWGNFCQKWVYLSFLSDLTDNSDGCLTRNVSCVASVGFFASKYNDQIERGMEHGGNWQKRVSTRCGQLYEGIPLRVRAHFSFCQLPVFAVTFLFFFVSLFLFLSHPESISLQLSLFCSLGRFSFFLFQKPLDSLWSRQGEKGKKGAKGWVEAIQKCTSSKPLTHHAVYSYPCSLDFLSISFWCVTPFNVC